MATENEFLLYALLLGVFITFVYDVLRVFRRVVPHSSFFVSLEDLGFWIYCGVEVFLLMYRESNGTLRWFAVLGAIVGMFFYRKLISPFFVKYISLVLSKVLGVIGKILRWMFSPLSKLCRKTGQGAKKAGGALRTVLARIRRRMKNKLTFFFKMLKIGLKD